MKSLLFIPLAALLLMGVLAQTVSARTMAVRWQKPTTDKVVCGINEKEMTKAVRELSRSLYTKDIDVQFGYVTFTKEQPTGDAASAVGLWINGKPFEYWLHAQSAMNAGCVELTVDGQTYRTIPADLIVKAGMTAAEVMKAPVAREKPKQAAAH